MNGEECPMRHRVQGAQSSAPPLYDNTELWITVLKSAALLGAAEGEQFL